MAILLIFPALGILVFVILFLLSSTDHDRIKDYIRSQGGILRDVAWSPFGKGWLGSHHERIFQIIYTDADGQTHHATCKTGMLAGVYLTDDRIVGKKKGASELLDENQRLREEIESLKKKREE